MEGITPVKKPKILEFQELTEALFGIQFSNYEEFWKWSVENPSEFWGLWAKESGMVFKEFPNLESNQIFQPGKNFWEAKWFLGAKLNFAENLLKNTLLNPNKIAIHFQPEEGTLAPRYLHNHYLYREVANLHHHFKELGIQKGDRIAAVLPNCPESIIGMLATTSLGAIWSSASPDFGSQGILDRFSQIEPKVLILCNAYFFKGKEISCLEKWKEVIEKLPSLKEVIIWNFTRPNETIDLSPLGKITSNNLTLINWEDLQKNHTPSPIQFEPITFQDPVYIMFSSGTTGLPKCIVQGPGVLLNHLKELILHCDLREEESITYYTTCGWMMWNWVASSLFVGSRLCMYDGNPFYPDSYAMWRWLEREEISIFGTSAKYLTLLEKENAKVKESFPLSKLRLILSTGSPLPAHTFEYVYDSIKPNIHLASISGGTDLNGCFALGNPMLPVHKGELQCRGLGMAVEVLNEEGQPIRKEKGELVCLKPFPSMPLYFWNDPDSKKYQDAYFSRFPNVWCHGDFAEITEHNGVIIYGRSDATLNPGGVRIGTADIYNALESIPEVKDSVVVGQKWDEDERIILFVVSEVQTLDDGLKEKIRTTIREKTSPRHVPSLIIQVSEVPYTMNGKKVELAIKNILEGKPVKNTNALMNPSCLEEYRKIAETFLKKS